MFWVGLGIAILTSVAGFQILFVWWYIQTLRRRWLERQRELQTRSVDDLPPALVVLCLRGLDVGLEHCLRGIARQDYPDFEVVFVFDSREDSAWNYLQKELQQPYWKERGLDSRQIVLEKIASTGSLKCQAIAAALEAETDAEVYAFIDADCVVDRNWLADLVAPLQNPEIGATTGNRFFDPEKDSIASQLRAIWNSAAIVQMQLYSIAWGGSVAVRREVVQATQLAEVWRNKFCEDTILADVLKSNGIKLYRIPDLVVENKGSIDFLGAYEWITRQLVNSRRYARSWPLILLHGNNLTLALVTCLASLVMMIGGLPGGIFLFAAACGYQVNNFLLLLWINRWNRRLLAQRKQRIGEASSPGVSVTIPQVLAYFLSQLVQPICAWRAHFKINVSWRGINYRFQRDGSVKMLAYTPKSDTRRIK